MLIHITVTAMVILLAAMVVLRCLVSLGASDKLLPFALPKTERKRDVSAAKHPLWTAFFSALGLRLVVLLALVACVMLTSQTPTSFMDCLQKTVRWDGPHYVNLVEKGYDGYIENGQHLFLVFFPGYVWAVRLLRLLIPSTVVAGMLVSTLSYAGGCCFVYRLTEEIYGHRVAKDALLYLSLFPFSFFFGTVMTEGLFLLCTASACYYAYKQKWLWYGLFGILAAMTRMVGLLVLVPAVLVLLKQEKPLQSPVGTSMGRTVKTLLKKLPLLLMPLVGTGVYLLLNYRVDGDPFAYVTHQEHWSQGGMWVSGVMKYVTEYLKGNLNTSVGWAIWLPTLVLFLFFFGLLAVALRDRDNPSFLLGYGFVYFIANFSLSWLLSAGRYLSCGFMLFILLAKATSDKPLLRKGLLTAQAVLLGVYAFAYINGAQIM